MSTSKTRYFLKQQFETSDLGLAATLSASGCAVIGINKTDPKRVGFLFADCPKLQSLVQQFWVGELKLSATVLLEHIRQLKNRIYSSS